MQNWKSMMGCAGLALTLAWVAPLPLTAEEDVNSACLDCHLDEEDVEMIAASVHAESGCVDCHSDLTAEHPDDDVLPGAVKCIECHEEAGVSYALSVHGPGSLDGTHEAADCADCHGGHNVLPTFSLASPLHHSRQAETCGQCHEEAARDVQASVHGKSTATGRREAATCTDCHSEHRIEPLKGASARKSSEVCSNCHSSERINTKYHLPGDRVSSFFESYHGLAARYGSTVAANCGSCHGAHKVLPSSDPESTIHKDRLVETCGQCHPGATEGFAQGPVHLDLAGSNGDLGGQINWWVRRVYLLLIFGVIGAMLLHNGLLFAKKLAASRRGKPRTVVRMTRSQRVQHFVLLTSFIILAVTGFALRFPDSWLAWSLGANEPLRQWSHRIAGVVLLAVGVWHIVYLALTREGRQLFKDFFPTAKDLSDMWTNARYLIGRSKVRPRFARFGYAEKLEYWAVLWGTVIMGVTGLMIWLMIDVTQVLPRWTIGVATTIHYYEAVLACLAIVVWHFYHVIFDPDVYPVNWAWWDGKVSAEWHEHEHPLGRRAAPPSGPEYRPSGYVSGGGGAAPQEPPPVEKVGK